MRAQPQVKDFIRYYLAHVGEVIGDVGYFPASSEALARARDEWVRATGAAAWPTVDPAAPPGARCMSLAARPSSR